MQHQSLLKAFPESVCKEIAREFEDAARDRRH